MATMKCTNGHVQLHEAPCSCGAPKAKVDPWVKVGTTTIDGTVMQVATMLEASAWGPPVNDDEAEAHIDNFVHCGGPWLIGGRYLLPKGSHINGNLGTALIRCDIVRRQSEIDAEHVSRVTAEFHKDDAYAVPVCPECGPHGNRGEVLLASSWAKCTTCAGGKPGDLWGEVKENPTATALSSALIADGASPEAVEAGVQAFSELYMAEIDNLRRYLTGPPDGMSCDEYRRIMFGEWVP